MPHPASSLDGSADKGLALLNPEDSFFSLAVINKNKPESEHLTLNSFIVTETPYVATGYVATTEELAKRNILFMDGLSPNGNYIKTLLEKIIDQDRQEEE